MDKEGHGINTKLEQNQSKCWTQILFRSPQTPKLSRWEWQMHGLTPFWQWGCILWQLGSAKNSVHCSCEKEMRGKK